MSLNIGDLSFSYGNYEKQNISDVKNLEDDFSLINFQADEVDEHLKNGGLEFSNKGSIENDEEFKKMRENIKREDIRSNSSEVQEDEKVEEDEEFKKIRESIKTENIRTESSEVQEDKKVEEDDKLKKTQDKEKQVNISKKEVKKNLAEIANKLGMNKSEGEIWVKDVMDKAQQVYDEVYNDCIKNLKKTPERAKIVATFAYEFAVKTMVEKAENEQKGKNGVFV